ncbi:MAG: veratrol--corrinoid protein metyltransferase [Oscillospiraceae bacterium]|nr:veratrol--corrinoid protein metyltransferase [Oscillospiraceae bacterium]
MLSEKENFLRALSGEVPEYVPRYNIFWGVRPSIFVGERVNGVGKDMYGVEWTNEGSAFEAALPRNDVFLLDDIRHWRDVIKFPDFSGLDWDAMAKKDLKDTDPELPRGGGISAGGFFQSLMAFMGFTEGLVACFEEPEEVKALLNYLCDNYLSLADNYLKYYEPDYISFGDDIAHERNPFVSLEVFHDIFEPVWRRYIKFFKDRGYLAVHHNCGHFEAFLDDVVDMGFNAWDPAQESNDLSAIKSKFGNRLMICGGFESRRFLPHIDVSEEEIRDAVKQLLDRLAPGGGYAFFGGVLAPDPVSQQRTEWINDEFTKLRGTYYS